MSNSEKSPEPLYFLRGHSEPVNHVRFHGEDMLLSGSAEGDVKIWKLSRRRCENTITAHTQGNGGTLAVEGITDTLIARLYWRFHCNIVAADHRDTVDTEFSQGRDGCINVYDLNALPKPVTTIPSDMHSFCKLSYLRTTNEDQSAQLIAFPLEDSVVQIWDVHNNKIVHTLQNTSTSSKKVQLRQLPSGSVVLLAGYESGHITVWNIQENKVMMDAKLHEDPLLSIDMDSSCTKGICGSAGTNIAVFSVDIQKLTCQTIHTYTINHGGVPSVKIRHDSKIAVTSGWDHRLRVFDWNKPRPLAILKGHTAEVYSLDLSPASNLIASGSKDKRIALWSIY